MVTNRGELLSTTGEPTSEVQGVTVSVSKYSEPKGTVVNAHELKALQMGTS
jgi:hypothetical protein